MKNDPEIKISKNPAKEAGEAISTIFARNFGKPMLFAIAGGSSFDVLEFIDEEFLGPHITVVMTDERVSEELDINNFTQLQATHFYNKLINHDVFCISTELRSGETGEELRGRYDTALKLWKRDFPKGIVVGLYGIGEDGHTAGMIPLAYSEKDFMARYDGENMAEEYDAGDKNKFRHRVTTTLSFMRNIVDFGIFYLTGEKKKPILKKVLDKTGSLYKTPARIIHEMKNVRIFTDLKI